MVKNKVAPPFRQAEFDIMFNEGISATGDLLDLAVEEEVVQKSGAWFSFNEVRLGQGRENSKQFIKENPDLFEEIRKLVMVAKGIGEPVDDPAAGLSDDDELVPAEADDE